MLNTYFKSVFVDFVDSVRTAAASKINYPTSDVVSFEGILHLFHNLDVNKACRFHIGSNMVFRDYSSILSCFFVLTLQLLLCEGAFTFRMEYFKYNTCTQGWSQYRVPNYRPIPPEMIWKHVRYRGTFGNTGS